MSDPLGREVDRVSVRVLPNTRRFLPDLQKYLKRVETSVRVELPTSLDTSGLEAEARKAAAAIERSVSVDIPVDADTATAETKLDAVARNRTAEVKVDVDRKSLTLVTRALDGALSAIRALSIPSKGSSIALLGSGGIEGLAALSGVVVQAAGALALLPAFGLAASAAVGTLVLAFTGLKDSSVPAVVAVQTALEGVAERFQTLRETVQQHLFAGLDTELQGLASALIPVLQRRLSDIADSLNDIITAFSQAFQTPHNLRATNDGLSNTAGALGIIAEAIKPFVTAMADIAVVGSDFLKPFARVLSDAASGFADFIAQARKSGDLKNFIQGGIDAFGVLFQLVGDVLGIIGAIGKAATAATGGLSQGLGGIIGTLSDFLNSKQGQKALIGFFDGVNEGLSALGKALGGPVGKALLKVLPALGSILGDIGKVGAQVLVTIAETLAPLAGPLTKVADLLARVWVSILQAVTPSLVSLAQALGQALIQLVEGIGPALPNIVQAWADLATALSGALIEALPALVPALVSLFNSLVGMLPQIVNDLTPLIEALGPTLATLLEQVPQLVEILTPFLELLLIVIQPFSELLALLLPLAANLATLSNSPFFAVLGPIADLLENTVNPAMRIFVDQLDDLPDLFSNVMSPLLIEFFQDLEDAIGAVVDVLRRMIGLLDKVPSPGDILPGGGGGGFDLPLPSLPHLPNPLPDLPFSKLAGPVINQTVVAHDYDDFVRQSGDRAKRGAVGGVVFA